MEIKRPFEEGGKSEQTAFGMVEKAIECSGAATDLEVALFQLRQLGWPERLLRTA